MSWPVVMFPATIMWAPSQLESSMQVYTEACMSGEPKVVIFSALEKSR